ncbi:MAG TPA: hypothetical protein PKA58_15375 [Polyangium sp.]|nr:hypothetical protein [Polyangium sp.]
MQWKGLLLMLTAAGLPLVYGCHTIADVRTDAILDEGKSSSSSGMAGQGGMGGMVAAGGMGGMAGGGGGGGGGNCDPSNCLSKQCAQGACVPVNAKCSPQGPPFPIFLPTDFVDPAGKLLVGYNNKAVYVSIADEGGPNAKFRTRSIDAISNNVSNITDCTVPYPLVYMNSTRTSDTEFVVQGHVAPNVVVAEASIPLDAMTGDLKTGCQFQPLPSWSACMSSTVVSKFTRLGNDTKYAVTCEDPADPNTWHLVTGGSDEASYTDIGTGPANGFEVRASAISYINNERVVFVAPDLYGKIGFRRESKAYALEEFDLDVDPARQEAILAMVPFVSGQSVFMLAGSGLLPPQFDARLLGGVLSDMAQFATVPPTGVKEVGHFTGAEVAKLGTYGQPGEDAESFYVGVSPLSQKSADIYWLSKTGETLIAGQSAYVVPAGDNTIIPRVSFVPLGALYRVAVWREENLGTLTVRGQRFICSY